MGERLSRSLLELLTGGETCVRGEERKEEIKLFLSAVGAPRGQIYFEDESSEEVLVDLAGDDDEVVDETREEDVRRRRKRRRIAYNEGGEQAEKDQQPQVIVMCNRKVCSHPGCRKNVEKSSLPTFDCFLCDKRCPTREIALRHLTMHYAEKLRYNKEAIWIAS